MLTIAGGIILALFIIILALFIIAYFDTFLKSLLWVFLIGIISFLLYTIYKNIYNPKFIVLLCISPFAILAIFIHITYTKSRNSKLYFRYLKLLFSLPSLDPKIQVKKELAIENLKQDIVNHCIKKNEEIKTNAFNILIKKSNKIWVKYKEYGKLEVNIEDNLVEFSCSELGFIFRTKVVTEFPENLNVTIIYLDTIRNINSNSMDEFNHIFLTTLKERILEYERKRHGLTK